MLDGNAKRLRRRIDDLETGIPAKRLQFDTIEVPIAGAMRPQERLHRLTDAAEYETNRYPLVANLLDKISEAPPLFFACDAVKLVNDDDCAFVLPLLRDHQQRSNDTVQVTPSLLLRGGLLLPTSQKFNAPALEPNFGAIRGF